MDDREDGLFVTAGIKTPAGHLEEARRLWEVGHRIIEAEVDGRSDEAGDRIASAKLKWVKNELRKQLRLVEHLIPGMDADSLELFRLCSYADGRRVVIDRSAGIAWSVSQYQGGPTKLKADLNDWSAQVNSWFEGIRKQVGQVKPAKKPTANDLMKAELASNFEAVKGFTADQWAARIGKAKSTVVGTGTWKSLAMLRQQARAEKTVDRRRK